MAGHETSIGCRQQFGVDRFAGSVGGGTSVAEPAALGGAVGGGGGRVNDVGLGPGDGRVRHRDRTHEELGVGMQWVGEDRLGRPEFADPSGVEDEHSIADVADDGEVVGDEQQGDAGVVLHLHEQVEELGLNRDVEGGDDLVAEQHLRFENEGPGDRDPLTLSPGKLVDATVAEAVRVEFDSSKDVVGQVLVAVARDVAADAEALGDEAEDGAAGVGGRHGVLEHHLHGGPAAGEIGAAVADEFLTVESNGAGFGRLELHDPAGERGLAAAGFADDADRLTGAGGEADRLDAFDPSALDAVADDEVTNLEQGGFGGHGVSGDGWMPPVVGPSTPTGW